MDYKPEWIIKTSSINLNDLYGIVKHILSMTHSVSAVNACCEYKHSEMCFF